MLALTELRSAAMAPPKPAEVDRSIEPSRRGTPRERTLSALPAELGRGERMNAAIKAFFGFEEEPPIVESAEPATQSKRELLTKPEQRSARERGAGELARDRLRGAAGPRDRPRRG